MTNTTSQCADHRDDVDAVRAVAEALVAAWAAEDGDAFADLYTEDADVFLPGIELHGREDIRRYMTAGFAGRMRGSRVRNDRGQVRFLAADVALLTNTSTTLLPGEVDAPADRDRRATWVLTRSGTGWTIAAYANTPAGSA